MKKAKLKSLVKAARKTAEESIALKLSNDLKDFTAQLGQDSKKIDKEIKKGTNKLAKKIANEIKIDKSSLNGSSTEHHAVGLSKDNSQ